MPDEPSGSGGAIDTRPDGHCKIAVVASIDPLHVGDRLSVISDAVALFGEKASSSTTVLSAVSCRVRRSYILTAP